MDDSSLNDSDAWQASTDLMAGLMIVFLLIALVLVSPVKSPDDEAQRAKWLRENAELRSELIEYLCNGLRASLVEKQLADKVRACEPSGVFNLVFLDEKHGFNVGSVELPSEFKSHLSSLAPEISRVMDNCQVIEKIMIEGHTDPNWKGAHTEQDRYMKNLHLSQGRSAAVLQYLLTTPSIEITPWKYKKITATGRSFSDQAASHNLSRRVEMRFQIQELLSEISTADCEPFQLNLLN